MFDDQERRDTEELEAETCEPEECETQAEEQKQSGKAARKARPEKPTAPPAPAKSAIQPAPAARFLYPFNIRYAAEILDLTGFVDGQEYSEADIRQLLIQNGYTEFADIEPAFHLSSATNTLVITIKGSRKGGRHGC